MRDIFYVFTRDVLGVCITCVRACAWRDWRHTSHLFHLPHLAMFSQPLEVRDLGEAPSCLSPTNRSKIVSFNARAGGPSRATSEPLSGCQEPIREAAGSQGNPSMSYQAFTHLAASQPHPEPREPAGYAGTRGLSTYPT